MLLALGRYGRDAVSAIALSARVRTGSSSQRVKNLRSIYTALSHTLQGVIGENYGYGVVSQKALLHVIARRNPMIELDRETGLLVVRTITIPVWRNGS